MLYLAKLVAVFTEPLGIFFLLLLLGLFFFLRGAVVRGSVFVFGGVLMLLLLSMPVVANGLMWSLEKQHPPQLIAQVQQAEAIVILGGSVAPPVVGGRLQVELADSSDRVLHGARLYRAGKAPLIVVSAGNIPWYQVTITEAEAIRGLLIEWGVPDTAIVLEERSRTTYENAIYTKQLLDERGVESVLLVTSALHMPRSLALFKYQGVKGIIPAATDYLAAKPREKPFINYMPNTGALAASTALVHELVGVVYYRLRGWL